MKPNISAALRTLKFLVMFCIAVTAALPSPAAAAGTWAVVSSPSPSTSGNELRAVAATSASDVWAVGDQATSTGSNTLVEHWNGASWQVVGSPNPGAPSQCGNGNVLNSVAAVSTSEAWSVGIYYSCSLFKTLAAHWDGVQWTAVASPNPSTNGYNELRGVAAVAANDVWAVGHYDAPNGALLTLTIHWDGTAWSVVPSPNRSAASNVLNSVTAVSANDVWAVGLYYNKRKAVFQTLAEHWDGSAWSVVTSPNPSNAQDILNGVAAVAANNVWAVGTQNLAGNPRLTLIDHWNGVRWSTVASPNASTTYGSDNVLNSLAVASANDIWAVGMFQNDTTDNHQHRTLICHWDGTSWSQSTGPNAGKSSELLGVAALSTGAAWAVGPYSDYGVNIYDGTYIVPKTFVVQE